MSPIGQGKKRKKSYRSSLFRLNGLEWARNEHCLSKASERQGPRSGILPFGGYFHGLIVETLKNWLSRIHPTSRTSTPTWAIEILIEAPLEHGGILARGGYVTRSLDDCRFAAQFAHSLDVVAKLAK